MFYDLKQVTPTLILSQKNIIIPGLYFPSDVVLNYIKHFKRYGAGKKNYAIASETETLSHCWYTNVVID